LSASSLRRSLRDIGCFQFLPREVMPDQALLVVASDDSAGARRAVEPGACLWSLAAGGTLKIGF
jgi:hypothetical protein